MAPETGNVSDTERIITAVAATALSLLALRRSSAVFRGLTGMAATALWARVYTGQCPIKSTCAGQTTLAEGMADQWRRLLKAPGATEKSLHSAQSNAFDESLEDSFPASDPPASRLPDEPPANAEAKWAAARAQGG